MSAATSASTGTRTRRGGKRQGELSDFDRGRIVGLDEGGIGIREIGRRLGRNEATIRSFLKRWVKSEST